MMNKTVIVTGAAKGVGREIALAFARKGYNVAITTLKSKEQLLKTKKDIEEVGVKCLSYICDGGDFAKVLETYEDIIQRLGKVDVLVNNGGISYVGLLTDMAYEDFDYVIKNNLYSVFNWSKCVTADMVSRKEGKILNVSSVWGEHGASCEVAYSASKAGINGFTKALGKELGPSNVQVNGFALGIIDTEMNDCLDYYEKKNLETEIPMGRFGTPWEIGEIICDFAQGKEYITGQIIGINGGFR
ncbi:MAG: SDR family NAD(P)-dependent oxidoreductase [Anaerovoracaceae bacterium]